MAGFTDLPKPIIDDICEQISILCKGRLAVTCKYLQELLLPDVLASPTLKTHMMYHLLTKNHRAVILLTNPASSISLT